MPSYNIFSGQFVRCRLARRPWSLLALVLGAAALGCGQDTAPLAPTETPGIDAAATASAVWQPRADYPTSVYQATSAAYTNPNTLKTTLYVFGGGLKQGSPAGSLTDAVWAYNVSANTWSAKAKLPIVLTAAHQAVQLNGKIYVAGGFTRYRDLKRDVWRLSTSKALYVYDIPANSWTRKADMPIPSVHGVSVVYNGFIYVASACYDASCGDTHHGAVWRYNPGTDRWVLESRVPGGETWRAAGGLIGGKLYLVDDLSAATDIYDLATKVWTSGPARPTDSNCGGASTAFQARVYIANCFNGTGEAMFVLDPKANTWTQLPAAPEGGYATMTRLAVNGRNRLELVGGAKPGNNWQYTP